MAAALSLGLAGCTATPLLSYRIDVPAQTLTAVGTAPAHDGRARFREIFCPLADEETPAAERRACDDLLVRLAGEALPVDPPAPPPPPPPGLRLIIVPGLLGDCAAPISVPFSTSVDRLRAAGYRVDTLLVSGRASSAYNAKSIAATLAAAPNEPGERLILIGHSKGAVDILEFLVAYPDAAREVTAVVSVAGAINGSPIADKWGDILSSLLASAPLGNCDPGDKGAAESLKRTTRLTWLATHPLPSHVRYFSVGAFANREDISTILQPGWDLLATIDPRNDGLLLFSDQVIPGATLLGYAHADHVAVVLPASETAPRWVLSFLDRTQYPQDALLDAILRTVGEEIGAPR